MLIRLRLFIVCRLLLGNFSIFFGQLFFVTDSLVDGLIGSLQLLKPILEVEGISLELLVHISQLLDVSGRLNGIIK